MLAALRPPPAAAAGAPARLLRLRSLSALPRWATLDPSALGADPTPHAVSNIVGGEWRGSSRTMTIPNPLDRNAPAVCTVPDTGTDELGPFVGSLRSVPKSGVHNPLKNCERYLQYGEISRKVRGSGDGGSDGRLSRTLG